MGYFDDVRTFITARDFDGAAAKLRSLALHQTQRDRLTLLESRWKSPEFYSGAITPIDREARIVTIAQDFLEYVSELAVRPLPAPQSSTSPSKLYILAHKDDPLAPIVFEHIAALSTNPSLVLRSQANRPPPSGPLVLVLLLTRWSMMASWVISEIVRFMSSQYPMAILLEPNASELSFNIPGVEEQYFRVDDRTSVGNFTQFMSRSGASIVDSEQKRVECSNRFFESTSALFRDQPASADLPIAFDGILQLAMSAHPHLREQLRKEIDKLRDGNYLIVPPEYVYHHDAILISELKDCDIFATHPISDNKTDKVSGPAYRKFLNAQTGAAQRNVKVRRLYIYRDNDLTDSLLRQLMDLQARGIEVKLIRQQQTIAPEENMSRDFVIFGDHCFGIGIPAEGPLVGSRYWVLGDHASSEARRRANAYRRWFDDLWADAEDVPHRRNLTVVSDDAPAIIDTTPVNLSGVKTERLMVVFRTGGCVYDDADTGCTMCEFRSHALNPAEFDPSDREESLRAQFRRVETLVRTRSSIGQVDLLTLGSFLHDREVPASVRVHMIEALAQVQSVRRVVVESRSQYVRVEVLQDLRSRLSKDQTLELGVGVETSNDLTRMSVLNKGMSESSIKKAIESCAKANVHFMAYLLIGTPTLSEADAIADAVQSCRDVKRWCDAYGTACRVSFEPVFITEKLQKNFPNYQLISLWSVVETVAQVASTSQPIYVGLNDENLSHGKKPRAGCRVCDGPVVEAIQEFNGTQRIEAFDSLATLGCSCLKNWIASTKVNRSWGKLKRTGRRR